MLNKIEASLKFIVKDQRPLVDPNLKLKKTAAPYSVEVDKDILENSDVAEIPSGMSLMMDAACSAYQYIYERQLFVMEEDCNSLEEAKLRVRVYSLTLQENMKSEDPLVKKSALIRGQEFVNSARDSVGYEAWKKCLVAEHNKRERFKVKSNEIELNKSTKHTNILMQPNLEYTLQY